MRRVSFRTVMTVALAAALFVCTACSDDTDTGKKKDTGVVADVGADAGADKGTPDTGTPDQGSTPDKTSSPDAAVKPIGAPCSKDTDCYPNVPYCDTTNKICVQCLKTADCAQHSTGGLCSAGTCTCAADSDCKGTRVAGSKCVSSSTSGKFCGCAASTDCTGTSIGNKCDTSSGRCTCSAAADCKTGTFTVCSQAFLTSSTIKSCNTACTADAACAKEIYRKTCDTTAGGCVACNKAADCSAYKGRPWSTTCSKKFCTECVTNSDCTSKSLGNTCDTTNFWCVCKTATDCAANENGKLCDSSLGACNCKADTDCPTGKKCTRTSPYLPSLKYCQ